MKTRRSKKTAKQAGYRETLPASSNSPSSIIYPDPAAEELPDEEASLIDPDTSPERYLPDEEEVIKDLPH
ncbi:hypothetical protein DSO57_1013561 [Entomophthora muscae]|uniref:Uncharacterized protein n=1 Tax=Entomophthora muscae TaxID=34485 RepID=A0ACC2RKC2_9FUNG|nr:hypothetical protein DSO57_1013561 [Entomophthora muscae]